MIGVQGTRGHAEVVKTSVSQFLTNTLGLTLSAEKTKITLGYEGFVFLGFKVIIGSERPYCVVRKRGLRIPLNPLVYVKTHALSLVKNLHAHGLVKVNPGSKTSYWPCC